MDLVLDAEERVYRQAESLLGEFDSVDVSVAHLPYDLRAAARQAAQLGKNHGLPLDLFLSPRPGAFSVAAWVESPYLRWEVCWRPTLDARFFDGWRDEAG